MLLDDFTERVDTDISNDAAMLGSAGPPRSFGLYRDGNRLASLPHAGRPVRPATPRPRWRRCPTACGRTARVLLVGASGGFRIAEALALGAAEVDVLEPEPVLLRRAAVTGLAPRRPLAPDRAACGSMPAPRSPPTARRRALRL